VTIDLGEHGDEQEQVTDGDEQEQVTGHEYRRD
jgi:hypothetical protein